MTPNLPPSPVDQNILPKSTPNNIKTSRDFVQPQKDSAMIVGTGSEQPIVSKLIDLGDVKLRLEKVFE